MASENSRRDSALEDIARELAHTNQLLEQLVNRPSDFERRVAAYEQQLKIEGIHVPD